MKIVINKCFGGFGLSEAAVRAYFGRKGKQVFAEERRIFTSYFDEPMPDEFKLADGEFFMRHDDPRFARYNKWYAEHDLYDKDIPRDDKDLIAVVEELGGAANGEFAKLEVIEIPDGVEWEISEYDGQEHIAETHRTWG